MTLIQIAHKAVFVALTYTVFPVTCATVQKSKFMTFVIMGSNALADAAKKILALLTLTVLTHVL